MTAESRPPRCKIPRARIAVFKFCSCDGCQLQLVDMADEARLLDDLLDAVEISYFLEVDSDPHDGPYDLGIVEGSISTPADQKRIRRIREQCRSLISIGACATSGGIQALRNWGDHARFLQIVYAKPDYIKTLAGSTAIADHVLVDFELRGCPINKDQLHDVVSAFLLGSKPRVPTYSVCMESKRRGNVCVTVARGEPCLGPVTQAGCGALCPAFDRGCYGCFGAMEQSNMKAQANLMKSQGCDPAHIGRAFRSFAHALPFDNLSNELLDRD